MSSMHIWISLVGAPVPVLSTADQVTGYTFTWLTQLPVIDNMPAFVHCCSYNIIVTCRIMEQVINKNKNIFGYAMCVNDA